LYLGIQSMYTLAKLYTLHLNNITTNQYVVLFIVEDTVLWVEFTGFYTIMVKSETDSEPLLHILSSDH